MPPRFAASILALSLVSGAALCPLPAGADCNRDLLFTGPTQYPVGVFGASLVLGTFHGGATLDMAVTNVYDNTISVLLGNGAGGFGAQTTFPTGSMPRGIAEGDFNGDGVLDLAVTHVGDQTVGILLGDATGGAANGSFLAMTAYPAGYENRGIEVVDLNGDGILDLVIAARTSVAVLLGNGSGGVGDGTFGAPTQYPTPSSWGVAVGDFNGDGITDIAAGNWLDAEVTVLLGNGAGGVGDGTFTAGTTILTPGGCADITSGDLNGDGILDLAAAGSSGI